MTAPEQASKSADQVPATADGEAATRDEPNLVARGAWWRSPVLWIALTVAVFLAGAWSYRWMSDDGFIHLRIVQQIEAGNGPVFNAGERVEASTSPAWTWLLVLGDEVLPLRLEWIAVLFGIALSCSGLALAMMGSLDLLGGRLRGRTAVPAGGLVLAVLPAMWLNASMGLENGLVFAWLGAVAWRLGRWSRTDAPLGWADAVLLGFGTLIRPELALVSAVVLVAVGVCEWRRSGWRRLLGIAAAALALPLAYEVFRAGYYASLVPNSGIAKEASKSYWSAGWDYLVATVNPYALWIPVGVLGFALVLLLRQQRGDRRSRAFAVSIAFVVAGIVNALFVVRVGGDFYHARLLLPPLFALLVPVAMVPWERRYAPVLLIVPWAALSALWMRSPLDEPIGMMTGRNPVTIDDYERAMGGMPPAWFDGDGLYVGSTRLDDPPAPGMAPAVASYGIGSIGYVLGPDVYVLDQLGLGDALTAHLALPRRGPLVGHEKPLPAPWSASRLTAADAEPTESDFSPKLLVTRRIDDPDGEPFDERVSEARRALRCGAVRDLDEATSDPMSVGRFFSNLVDAPRLTSLRIPAEPRDAVERFC